MVGRVLGHYRIVAAVGAGGMGEVYAADDLKLHRRVALKVLPALMAASRERRDRFTQEARAVAALSHPNIVTVYSIEEADGVHFLTMEFIEGQSLQARIPRGGLALDTLLGIAIPLVEAVAAAHARGITHRDLKPANVMITPDGRVKVLDFGLAKLHDRSGMSGDGVSTTIGLTVEGRIVGTAAYMAPEQAESRPVDHRADLFSLGVILYEMASGDRPFKGDSPLSVLTSVLRDQPPPLSGLNPALPRDLSKIVRKCLAKDPDRRYQSAKDLRNDLEDLRADLASGELTKPAALPAVLDASMPWRRRAGWLAGWVVAAAALGWIGWQALDSRLAPAPASWHFSQITSLPDVEQQPTLSPDGRWVAFAHASEAGADIYLQGVGGTNAINLTKTAAARNLWPAFSPDGERLAFWSDRQGGGVYVMGRTGESARRLTDFGEQPSWTPDGRHLVVCTSSVDLPLLKSGVGQLWIIDVEGGTPPRRIEGPYDVMTPRVSPDGRRIAYWGFASATDPNREVWTVSIDGGTPERVTSDPAVDWNPVWAPDGQSLYFLSDRGGTMQIWQVPIDERSGRVRGTPQSLTTPSRFVAHLTVSGDGRRLAYSSMDLGSNIRRYGFNPAGGIEAGAGMPVTAGSRAWTTPSPSPDGSMIAFTSTIGQEDVFVARADGTDVTQLTSDSARDRSPKWSPDGRTLAFHSDRGGTFSIWTIEADGSGLTRVLDPGADGVIIPVWSPDGKRLAVSQGTAIHRLAIVERTATGWGPPQLVPAALPGFAATSWSADGEWILGMNIGSGWKLDALYLPTMRYQTLVSEPGAWPVWLPDSRRFLFMWNGRLRMGDRANPTGAREVGNVPASAFDVARDGRFLLVATQRDEGDLWLIEAR